MAKANRSAARKRGGAQAGNGRGQGEPLTTFFRNIFAQNPKLLSTRSNEELIRRWKEDHPGQEVTKQVQAALANAKSAERHKRRKKGRRQKAEAAPTAAAAAHALPKPANPPRGLEALEEQIDDALSLAKHLDREALGDIIKLLHRARNQVVWKMGQ
jgi:hypothetical protein